MNDTEHGPLPLTPAVFHILLSLAGGSKHGYAIMKDVGEHTNGELRLGPGKLYYSIQRLLDDRLIEEVEGEDTPDGRRRRPYRITAAGRRVARAEARRLRKSLRLAEARRVIGD